MKNHDCYLLTHLYMVRCVSMFCCEQLNDEFKTMLERHKIYKMFKVFCLTMGSSFRFLWMKGN